MGLMAKRKNPAAVALGKRGAKARMTKLTPEQRKEVARKGAAARWKGKPAAAKAKKNQRARGE
jgi:hypothetical protein